MNEKQQKLIQLIKKAVVDKSLLIELRKEDDDEIYELACDHSVSHLIGALIEKNEIHMESNHLEDYRRHYYFAVRQILLLNEEVNKLKRLFEANNIDYILLKGLALRSLYPKDWMRLSNDIDFLVRENDLKYVSDLLIKQEEYQFVNRCEYHESFISPRGLKIEVHFTLSDEQMRNRNILDSVWNESVRVPNTKNEYKMTDSYLYFYHIYHMAKHFRFGGPGIKTVLDTWILNHRLDFNKESRAELLKQGSLLLFAQSIEDLSEKWFSYQVVPVDEELENYIIAGGAFGKNQRVAAVQAQTNKRSLFILRRAFPTFRMMKSKYPLLYKCPILLPFCWMHRLILGLFNGKIKKAKYELEISKNGAQQSKEIAKLYQKLGLEERGGRTKS